jgi:hypothetical protein
MVKIAKKEPQHHQDPSFQMKVPINQFIDLSISSDG